MMTVATSLFLIVEAVIIYSAIKFRRREKDLSDGPAIKGNVPLEILWTAIPTVPEESVEELLQEVSVEETRISDRNN